MVFGSLAFSFSLRIEVGEVVNGAELGDEVAGVGVGGGVNGFGEPSLDLGVAIIRRYLILIRVPALGVLAKSFGEDLLDRAVAGGFDGLGDEGFVDGVRADHVRIIPFIPLLLAGLVSAFALGLPDLLPGFFGGAGGEAVFGVDGGGAFEFVDFVAELGGAFELEVFGGFEHFFFEEFD